MNKKYLKIEVLLLVIKSEVQDQGSLEQLRLSWKSQGELRTVECFISMRCSLGVS